MGNQDSSQIVGEGVLCISRLPRVGGSGKNGERREGDDPDDEDLSADDDDADQQRILKQVSFPPEIERGDVNASGLVTKVSKAIQKRLARLEIHRGKLEGIANKSDVQNKFLKCTHLFSSISSFHFSIFFLHYHYPID